MDPTDRAVRFSVNEAIILAHERAVAFTVPPPRVYANILETILSEMGTQEENAITENTLDKIYQNSQVDPDAYRLDFNNETNELEPGPRPRAIARGLRPWLNPDCLRGVPELTDASLARQKEKDVQWTELASICKDRLANARPDWKEAPENARLHDTEDMRARRELLLWCQLFVGEPSSTSTSEVHVVTHKPWAPEHHHCYPSHVILYARELLRIGSHLERSKTGFTAGGIKEIWDREIVPFVVPSREVPQVE